MQAQNIIKAYEVATDYIELNFTQPFDIVGIKWMDRIIILNDLLRKHVEAQEGANEEGEESNDGEDQRNDTKYYKVEADVVIPVSYTHLDVYKRQPIWAVFLVVANFTLSIKVAAKTIPDIKDDENS